MASVTYSKVSIQDSRMDCHIARIDQACYGLEGESKGRGTGSKGRAQDQMPGKQNSLRKRGSGVIMTAVAEGQDFPNAHAASACYVSTHQKQERYLLAEVKKACGGGPGQVGSACLV